MVESKLTKDWTREHLLGLRELSKLEIETILNQTQVFKEILMRPIPKVPTLRGKTIANLFFEPSTRTKLSFELAAKRLSADTLNVSASSSSVLKGESIRDTAKNIRAMNVDIIIIRHSSPGVPYILSKTVDCSIVNAGDGAHEHPTQGLLDLFTIKEHKRKIDGLNVSIIGDIAHSRVARSNIWGLTKLGAKVTVCGPATLIPPYIEDMGVRITYDVKEAVKDADVINVLRIQKERQRGGLFPSLREYAAFFGINKNILKYTKSGLLVMHPGPINRGVELSQEVADMVKLDDGSYSVILDQVTNGIAVRMAVLYLISIFKKA